MRKCKGTAQAAPIKCQKGWLMGEQLAVCVFVTIQSIFPYSSHAKSTADCDGCVVVDATEAAMLQGEDYAASYSSLGPAQ